MRKAIVLLVALVFLMGCTDTSELDNKIKSLEDNVASLEKTKTELSDENAKLRTELDDVKAKYEDIDEKYSTVATQLEAYQSAKIGVVNYDINSVKHKEEIAGEDKCKSIAMRGRFLLNNTGRVKARDVVMVFGAKLKNLTLFSDEVTIDSLDRAEELDKELDTKSDEGLCELFKVEADEAHLFIKYKDDRPDTNGYHFWVDAEGKEHEETGAKAIEGVL